MTADPARIAILCRVVDHFGDAGVCWRLASQLACERHVRVTIVTDRIDVVERVAGRMRDPASDPVAGRPADDAAKMGIEIIQWPDRTASLPDQVDPLTADAYPLCGQVDPLPDRAGPLPGQADRLPDREDPIVAYDVLLSTFGCELPEAWRRAIAQNPGTVWLNLEHLSAEAWVDDFHLRRSVKPSDGAIEHFTSRVSPRPAAACCASTTWRRAAPWPANVPMDRALRATHSRFRCSAIRMLRSKRCFD